MSEQLIDFPIPSSITNFPVIEKELWTSRQRQASSLHEISYRACFKPQLPKYFITRFSKNGDRIYDPFMGRGTTLLEGALLGRRIFGNDINPLSVILLSPRLNPPNLGVIEKRLNTIPLDKKLTSEIDLSMFYHKNTEGELISLKHYLQYRKMNGSEDNIDRWIRMVATNRLTGHSPGFFSVYTLPPNQAVSPESQIKINYRNNQVPDYRDIKKLILKKSKSLLRSVNSVMRSQLNQISKTSLLLQNCADNTPAILDNSIQLTVTSPPFLDVVQYAKDNWLRCWFNEIDVSFLDKKLTVVKSILEWRSNMQNVFMELFRITKPGGYVAFEVGEVRNGKVQLENEVLPIGLTAGFTCIGIYINYQGFTKTSNIWGIKNNRRGTNSNRIVVFKKL